MFSLQHQEMNPDVEKVRIQTFRRGRTKENSIFLNNKEIIISNFEVDICEFEYSLENEEDTKYYTLTRYPVKFELSDFFIDEMHIKEV